MGRKETTTKNALDAIEYETLDDYFDFKDEKYCLIFPDRIFQSFLQRSGFLAFFLEYSTSNNLGIFCRSPGYKKGEGEICCNVSPEQFKSLVQRLKFDILSNNTITDKTCHQIIEDELNIPRGILSLGREGIYNYLHDLRSGEHKVFVARGMLVGCEEAGKTSLLLRLQGKDNPNPQSTRGLKVHLNMFTVNEERLDVTINQNKPTLLSNLNIQENLNTKQPEKILGNQTSTNNRSEDAAVEKRVENADSFIETPLTILENNEKVPEVTENSKTRKKVFNENVIPNVTDEGNKGSSTTEPSKVNDEDVETIDFGSLSTDDGDISPDSDITFQTLSDSFTDKESKIITFFDFAGQFAYYACHHIYFSPNDFYILVMDITKKFDHMVYKDKAKEKHNQDGITQEEMNKIKRSVFSGWTYLDFTEYWLQSILSHTVGLTPNEKKEDGNCKDKAPLILLATHAEGISRKEAEAYFRDLRDKLPKLSAYVDYRKAFSTGFDDNLQEIKNCILEVVQTLPNWGKNIPMSWFNIESQIRKLKKWKIITLKILSEKCIASNVGIQSQNDLITPLRFLNNIGVVLYFDEEHLKEIVILDVQWFVDAFKHVITDEKHAKLDVDQQLYEEWKFFNETGLLSMSLLQSIWSRCPEGALYITKRKEILSYMVRLNLLTEVATDMWYCPCMNKQIFPTKQFEHLKNSSLLCFQFSYLPKELFHRVIAACSNQLKWKIFKMEYLCIYQMATLFDVSGRKVLVGMYSNNKIVIQFLDIYQSEMIDNLGVRGQITKIIDMSAEKLINCKYDTGYMCQKDVFGMENVPILHFIPESEMIGGSINCPKCGFQRKIIVEEIIWKEKFLTEAKKFPLKGEGDQRRPMSNSHKIGKMTVEVVVGTLSSIHADVLVCKGPKHFTRELNIGGLSQSLLAVVGEKMQRELDNNSQLSIDYGECVVFKGSELNCICVYHGGLPKWGTNSPDPSFILKKIMSECLKVANHHSTRSIAFSTLGLGSRFPVDQTAKLMVQCLHDFNMEHCQISIEKVIIVVNENEKNWSQIQSKILQELKGQMFAATVTKTVYSSKIDGVSVNVKVGNITEEKIDVIVNSVTPDLGMGAGTAAAVATAAGTGLTNELTQNYPNGIQYGEIAFTAGHDITSVKEIYHGTLLPWYSKRSGSTKPPAELLEEFVMDCLQKANSSGHKSIAFPALGTEYHKFPADIAASSMVLAFEKFCITTPKKNISDIQVVLFGGSSDVQYLEKAFQSELSHMIIGMSKESGANGGKAHKTHHRHIPRRGLMVTPQHGTRDYLIWKYQEAVHTPSYWTKFSDKMKLKEWNLAMLSGASYLENVDQNTFHSIEKAFKSTLSNKQIVSIQRIENVELFLKYSEECRRLFRKAIAEGDFVPLDKVSGSSGPAKTMGHLDTVMINHTHHEINEYYFFHGTQPGYVSVITGLGLDNILPYSVGLLGTGVYGAEDSVKSDRYTGVDTNGNRPMFLMRMCLGDIYMTTKTGSFKRPPCKKCGQMVCTSHKEIYDSVVGGFPYREFVVYDRCQSYPEYLIWYR